jgi:hypothetical protein
MSRIGFTGESIAVRETITMQRPKTQATLLATGFVGLLFVLTNLTVGALVPEYDALRDTISALALTNLGFAQRMNFLVFGMALCAFAVALRRELGAGRGAALIPIVQSVTGVGLIGDAIFVYGPMHMVCDLIAFNSALLVLFLFAWRFAGDDRWKGWAALSIVTALLMMAFLAAFGVANHVGGTAGLFEKLASLTRSSWSVLLVQQLYAGRVLTQPA